VSAKAQLLVGAGLNTVASLTIALRNDTAWTVAVEGAVFGIGLGLVYSSIINLIVQSVPRHQTGVASGMNTNIRTIGASIGTAVVGAVIAAHPAAGGLPAESGYTESFVITAVAGAAAFMLALLVPVVKRTNKLPQPEELPDLTPADR